MSELASIITAVAPVLVAIVGIVPTVISNRKKAEQAMEAVKKEVVSMRAEFEQYKTEDGDRWARAVRDRILKFEDKLCEPSAPYPSEANFRQAAEDCDYYHQYVERRQREGGGFSNGIADAAMEHIGDEYRHCRRYGLFGQSKQAENGSSSAPSE